MPLIYTNVLIRNWEAMAKLGVAEIRRSRRLLATARTSISRCRWATTSSPTCRPIPILLHISAMPLTGDPKMSAREQAPAGRYQLAEMPFEDLERELRDLLNRALRTAASMRRATSRRSPSTAGATATRSNTCVPGISSGPTDRCRSRSARKAWGRIAIANSDAGAYAYAHSAIDQAGRAVNELLGGNAITGFSTFPGPPIEVVG